jgi:hypothetical protein
VAHYNPKPPFYMTRVLLSILFVLAALTSFSQMKGWTIKSGVPHEIQSVKPMVDEVRSMLPAGTYCTYSVKSQELWIISDHSPESRAELIEQINQRGHYVYQITPSDRAAQRTTRQDLKERFILDNQASYNESCTQKVYMSQGGFDALPTKTQLKIAQSDNVIVQ